MPKCLTDDQIHQYHDQGYVAPVDIFTKDEVVSILVRLERAEADQPAELSGPGRNNAHYVLLVLDEITHHPCILDAVEDLIGPDILVAGTTLFINDPETQGFVSWHQDARYIGLEPHDWVTGWIALNDVDLENGCMQMIPGTHHAPLADHVETHGEDNLLTRGQTIVGVKEEDSVPLIMKAGQLSLHHPRIYHGSRPNVSNRRRVGFAIQSYIALNVKQVLSDIWVQQARGSDEYMHHQHAYRPSSTMQDKDIAFRNMVNNKLSEIFYVGSAKKGKY